MPISTLCLRRSTLLLVSDALEAAGFMGKYPQSNPNRFLTNLSTEQPHYVLITSEYLNNPPLFEEAKRIAPKAQLILCLLQDAVATIGGLWPMLDILDFDALCSLDELTNCLTTLKAGHFYKSALMATLPVFQKKETLPGFSELSPVERSVLTLMLRGMKGRAIANELCMSYHTFNNHKTAISQKLGVSGGPGSLISFVLVNAEILRRLLAEK